MKHILVEDSLSPSEKDAVSGSGSQYWDTSFEGDSPSTTPDSIKSGSSVKRKLFELDETETSPSKLPKTPFAAPRSDGSVSTEKYPPVVLVSRLILCL